MINRVLFLMEQYCDSDERFGPTNSEMKLVGSVISTGLVGETRTFYYDTICRQIGREAMAKRLVSEFDEFLPELVIYSPLGGLHGLHHNPIDINPGSAGIVKHMRERGAKIYSHLWDTVGRDHETGQRNILYSDYVGIADSVAHRFRHEPKVLQAYTSIDSQYFHDHGLDRDTDICFVGGVDAEGQRWPQRARYIEALRSAGINIVVAGGQRQGRISWEEYAGTIGRSRISLNFARHDPIGTSQIKGRVFETMFCRTMLLEERGEHTWKFFRPGREFADYDGPDELIDRVRYYLSHEKERNAIADAGWGRATRIYNAVNLWGYLFEKMGYEIPHSLAADDAFREHRMIMDSLKERGTAIAECAEDGAAWYSPRQHLASIVVPHAGPCEALRRTVENIRGATTTPYEIIIVEDKPDDSTMGLLDLLAGQGIRVIINAEMCGVEPALNQGFQAAKGEYICLLTTDVTVPAGWTAAMSEALNAHGEYGWVALPCEQTGFFAGCSMMTREAYNKVGLWDEAYAEGYGFSDDDYLRRMWDAGYDPHIVDGLTVIHGESKSRTRRIYGEAGASERFALSKRIFEERWGETGTNWDTLPRYKGLLSWGRGTQQTGATEATSFDSSNSTNWGNSSDDGVCLNLGSFVDTVGSDWVNIDILPLAGYVQEGHKFLQHDLRAGLPYGNDSVSLIRSSHLLEHLTLEECQSLLREAYRVLRPGGLIRIGIPDLDKIIDRYTHDDMERFDCIQPDEYQRARTQGEKFSRFLFSGDYNHRAVYTYEMLAEFLRGAGFESVAMCEIDESQSHRMISETQDQHPHESMYCEAVKGDRSMRDRIIVDRLSHEYYPGHVNRRSWILSQVREGERILDIGANNRITFGGTRYEPYVTPLDIDLYDLPGFICMDAECLVDARRLIPDASYDVAVLGDILEHVDDPVRVLNGAARVAGRIVITVPEPSRWADENRPYETMEQMMERKGQTRAELARDENPAAIKLWGADGYTHLFHKRWYTYAMMMEHLNASDIPAWTIESEGGPNWGFLAVVAEGVPPRPSQEASSLSSPPPTQETPQTQSTQRTQQTGCVVKWGTQATQQTGATLQTGATQETGATLQTGATQETEATPLKIALVSSPFFTVPPAGYGGLERVVYDLACGLAGRGHAVTVFAPDGSHVPGCAVVPCGTPLTTVNVDWRAGEENMWNVYRDMIGDFDIVHSHDWFGYVYASKQRNMDLRVTHTHHGGLDPRWWGTSVPPFKLNFIALSNWMKSVYETQGMPSRACYNGVSTEKYGFKADKGDRMIFVGRIDTFKQPHAAIEVAKMLGMGLDVVGGTFVQSTEYLRAIKGMCDGDQIRFIEDPPQDEKVRLMQDACCLLFPSKMGEPWGLVAAEAMSCGTPVVALRDGAIPEVVDHGVTGYVCDTVDEMCDSVKIADKIDPRACRERVERLFSQDACARGYEEAYRDILAGREW